MRFPLCTDNTLCSNAMTTIAQNPSSKKQVGMVANTLNYREGGLLSSANSGKEEIMRSRLSLVKAHCTTSLVLLLQVQ